MASIWSQPQWVNWARAVSNPVNTLRPRRNEQHFADDIFKRIFFNENVWISIKISLKFVPKGPINNIPALIQIMAWRRSGDKPLSEPMMVSLPTHICVTRPQWVNYFPNPPICHCSLPLESPIVVMGDMSGSMDVAIRTATIIAAIMTAITKAKLVFFNTQCKDDTVVPTNMEQVGKNSAIQNPCLEFNAKILSN